MRKFIALTITIVMVVLSSSVLAFAESNHISVKIDGSEINFPDVQPYLDDFSRTQVPIRFVGEALKAVIKWDEATRTATIAKENIEIKITVEKGYIIVNDNEVVMDTYARLEHNRLFVPLRYICNALNANIEWDSVNRTVEIISNDANISNDFTDSVFPNNTGNPKPPSEKQLTIEEIRATHAAEHEIEAAVNPSDSVQAQLSAATAVAAAQKDAGVVITYEVTDTCLVVKYASGIIYVFSPEQPGYIGI